MYRMYTEIRVDRDLLVRLPAPERIGLSRTSDNKVTLKVSKYEWSQRYHKRQFYWAITVQVAVGNPRSLWHIQLKLVWIYCPAHILVSHINKSNISLSSRKRIKVFQINIRSTAPTAFRRHRGLHDRHSWDYIPLGLLVLLHTTHRRLNRGSRYAVHWGRGERCHHSHWWHTGSHIIMVCGRGS